ncbi:chloride channel [Scheffersomyces xylosifermentans]|uniref:chloride channel n=1 Tax=Scheffersomyces xylosifermentans TaxID=1304137 RepID=UPI00315CD4A6
MRSMDLFSSGRGAKVSYSLDDVPTLTYHNEQSNRRPIPTSAVKYYENNTYIDWSRESLIVPSSSSFISKKWFTVILSSIIVGYATAFIDLSSVWLNDLRKGICFSKVDTWSLLNPYSTCPADKWHDWSVILFNAKGVVSNIFVNFPIFLLLSFILVIVAAYITIEKDPLIKQSGIPEIKLIISGFNYKISEYLGLKTLFYKIVGLILTVSSGLWLGKEGPLVHVSCCILNILYDLIIGRSFENEAVRRELLSAATATGISVAFNSPIGGVLFVLESMTTFFMPTKIMWNSFVTATVAVIFLTGFKVFTDGQNFLEQDLFQVEFGNFSWLFLEIIPFTTIGVLGGVYGYLFIRFNSFYDNNGFRTRVHQRLASIFGLTGDKWGKYLEIIAVLLITSVLIFPIDVTKLPLNAFLKILFTACPTETVDNSTNFMCSASDGVTCVKLLFIVLQGFFLSSYTFGVELPGGILTPSLVLGATSGRLIGIVSQVVQKKFGTDALATCTERSCIVSPSSYAVIGAASFMTGITKLTMCVVVIMFELTGAVTYVLPIMLAVMISKFVNDGLCNENIYDSWLKNHFNKDGNVTGVPNEGKGTGLVNFTGLTSNTKDKLPDVLVKSVMIPLQKTKCLCLVPSEHFTRNSLYAFINDDCHEGYPLILNYSNPIYLGYVTKHELYARLSNIDDSTAIISLQVEGLPHSALSHQLHYERSISSPILQVDISIEKSMFVVNDLTSVVLTLETFEKMHLNYLIILDSNNRITQSMVGFVDRFVLANIIDSQFSSLNDELAGVMDASEFDIEGNFEDADQDQELLDLHRKRLSIELIT